MNRSSSTCMSCGAEMAEAKFCPECGTPRPLDRAPAPAPAGVDGPLVMAPPVKPSATSRRKLLLALAVAGIAVAVAVAVAAALALALGGDDARDKVSSAPSPTPSPTPGVLDVTGKIVLFDNVGDTLANPYIGHAFTRTGQSCVGRDSYGEFSPGHTAELVAADGTVVGSADVGTGAFMAASGGDPAGCLFAFNFTAVPYDLDLFKLTLQGRGGPTFRNEDLLSGNVGLEFNRPSK